MSNNLNARTDNKIIWVQNLRIFACLSVVMIHVIAGWFETAGSVQISNNRWILDNVIFQVLIRHAVPIFIMVSGYLLLNPKKEFNIKKLKWYIVKMLIVLLTFGYVFALIENIINDGFDNIISTLIKSFVNLIQEHSWSHLWYLYMLVGIYILTPVFRKFIEYAEEKEVKFVLIILLILSFVIPTINNITNMKITTFYLGVPIFSYIFYFLIGYYIGNNYIVKSNKLIYILGIIGVIGYMTLCFIKKYNSNINVGNTNIFTCLYSILVFKLFASEKIKFPNNKINCNIAKYSFTIYIIHTFWLNLFNKGFHIYPDILPTFIGELVFWIATVILSYISAYILSKIPYIKKILL